MDVRYLNGNTTFDILSRMIKLTELLWIALTGYVRPDCIGLT